MKRTPLRSRSKRKVREDRLHAPIREAVYERDNYRCQLYGKLGPDQPQCFGPLSPHHIKKASRGGSYTLNNLVTLCVGHNGWVEDNPDAAFALGLVERRSA